MKASASRRVAAIASLAAEIQRVRAELARYLAITQDDEEPPDDRPAPPEPARRVG